MKRKRELEKGMKRCRDETTEGEKVKIQEDCRCWAALEASVFRSWGELER